MRMGRWVAVAAGALVLGGSGCSRQMLAERSVPELDRVERLARSQVAFERARQRLVRVEKGMSLMDAEAAMGAVIAVEVRPGVDTKDQRQLPRRKIVEGLLCDVLPSAVRRRWIFGYDEGGVELVGFAIELTRERSDRDEWRVHRVDEAPDDDCLGSG
jgi:hypothetical protein